MCLQNQLKYLYGDLVPDQFPAGRRYRFNGRSRSPLDLTPAAVAQQIRTLEREFGAPLLARAGRNSIGHASR